MRIMRIKNKCLLVLWATAALSVLLLAIELQKFTLPLQRWWASPPWIVTVFIIAAITGVWFNRFLKLIIGGIFFLWLSLFVLLPQIVFDSSGFPLDADEYDTLGMQACERREDIVAKAQCLQAAVQRMQDEVKSYDAGRYQEWQKNAVDYCQPAADEYQRQRCLYDVAYEQLKLTRDINWRRHKP